MEQILLNGARLPRRRTDDNEASDYNNEDDCSSRFDVDSHIHLDTDLEMNFSGRHEDDPELSDDDHEFVDALMDLPHDPTLLEITTTCMIVPTDYTNYDDLPGGDWCDQSMSTASSFSRYKLTIRPHDVLCGPERYCNLAHPGNVTAQHVIQEYILPYALATEEIERKTIVSNIQARIESMHTLTEPTPRFLIPAPSCQDTGHYKEATTQQISHLIEQGLHSCFHLTPKAADVLMGRNESEPTHPGNIKLWAYIKKLQQAYVVSMEKHDFIENARKTVTKARGRFLVPYDNKAPAKGCILADKTSIYRMIADAFGTVPSFSNDLLTLESHDVLCGRGTYRNFAHPGNVTLQHVAMKYLLPYGKATTEAARSAIVSKIQETVESLHALNEPSPRFLVPARCFQASSGYYNKATANDIDEEIKHALRIHFNLIPTAADVLFGRGKPAREHPGNKKIREFIAPQRWAYAQANSDKQAFIQKAIQVVTECGGRFLMPFDKTTPAGGCILADAESIGVKIGHLFRDSEEGDTEAPGTNLQHRPTDKQQIRTAFYHFSATVDPTSKKSSSSSSSHTSTQNMDSTQSEFPPNIIQIHEGPSVSSTLLIDEEIATTAHLSTNLQPICCPMSRAPSRRMMKLGIVVILFASVVIMSVLLAKPAPINKDSKINSATNGTDSGTILSATLRDIRERGELYCGVSNQEVYSSKDPSTEKWSGFEVTICRALAAIIFGKEESVKFIPLESHERFLALKNKRIDVLLADTSYTMERYLLEPSTKQGYTFSTPYLVNGLIFAGDPDFLGCVTGDNLTMTNSSHCNQAVICVQDGTTHLDTIRAFLSGFEDQLLTSSTMELFFEHFNNGTCNILAGEHLDLSPRNVKRRPYEMGTKILSKELISIVTRDGDPMFSDIVNWMIKFMFFAEETGIRTSSEVLLTDIPTTPFFGKDFENMFQRAFEVVGHGGQLYEKYLAGYAPRVNASQINLGDTPAMYTVPFGNLEREESPPQTMLGPTLATIKSRGRLKCGVTDTPVFAKVKGGELVGLEVDYCKKLSAAIFDGDTGRVDFQTFTPASRIDALFNGKVDVLACATTYTMERDVFLRDKNGTGLSFSHPIFHDRIVFAGKQKFVQCAENADWESWDCSELVVCVTAATTQLDIVSAIFPSDRLNISDSTSETQEAFVDEGCNVMVGGLVQVSKASIEGSYQGDDYVVGSKPLALESLSLVTLDTDPFFSKIVNLMVVASLYAEEQGITNATSHKMPRVKLFGNHLNDKMLRNSIEAVGSYAEIWNRNAAPGGIVRDDRNQLNSYPFGPMLISDIRTWDDLSEPTSAGHFTNFSR